MTRRRNVPVLLVAGFLFVFVVSGTAFQQRRPPHNQPWGPVYKPSISADLRRYEQHRRRFRTHPAEARAMLLHWNDIATDAVALDHAAALFEAEGLYGDQLGPTRSSRALAIVHIAMFDAVNAFGHEYRSYSPMPPAPFGASMSAAIAQSAHDTLVDLYPSQVDSFNEELADDLACLADGPGKPWGIWLGKRAAALILAAREHDGAGPPGTPEPEVGVDYFPSPAPGKWRPDPISMADIALGARWGRVRPFVISSGARYRAAPPPDLTSGEYTDAYNEVKRIGGDGITTPTERTEEQTLIGLFWAYDGTPYIGTPPNLFNRITVTIANKMHTDVNDLARLLALVNASLADAAIAVWETKFYYNFWRPITAIRESDPGTGPTGLGDGNPDTIGDISWTPLGAPSSNLTGVPNFTPPFPSYTSGHAGFGGATFQTLRRFFGRDDITFTVVSDELNGITRDNRGVVRPLVPRTFHSLSEAEEEVGQSRIYLGIHFAFDKTDGIAQGRRVGDYVFAHAFTRR